MLMMIIIKIITAIYLGHQSMYSPWPLVITEGKASTGTRLRCRTAAASPVFDWRQAKNEMTFVLRFGLLGKPSHRGSIFTGNWGRSKRVGVRDSPVDCSCLTLGYLHVLGWHLARNTKKKIISFQTKSNIHYGSNNYI